MKTNNQNKTSSELQSRSEQLSKSVNAVQKRGDAAGRPFVSFKQRAFNRTLPTVKVLAALERWMPRQYELARVVGDWIWIKFPEVPPAQIRQELAELGFHWNSKRQLWQHPCGKGATESQTAA
jgi:hypothetical protein